MAYQINRFDGSILTVVEDGTIDRSTDLNLVGKNFAGYGEVQNENLTFLLENFASLNPPPRPISGQIWFDADTSKLKFYDGAKFRTTGGAEISASTPDGLTEGDFWWDTENEQLFAYNGNDFILVGPQEAGEGITQIQSRTVLGTDNISRTVLLSIINDAVVHIISNEEFEILATPENTIPGFDIVKRGITLVNTRRTTDGVTSTDHVFWGTAENANQLGGIDADQYVQIGDAEFDSLVEFSDAGLAIGDSLDLRLSIENDNEGVISNQVGNQIKFQTKNSQGTIKNTFRIFSDSIVPGIDDDDETVETVTIGSTDTPFSQVFADEFIGLAEKSTSLVVDGEERTGDVAAGVNTIAVRDVSGGLRAELFRGTALTARYADLAEKYTTDKEYPIGTVVSICSHIDHETEQTMKDQLPIGVISQSPAYLMNSDSIGQPVALKGRVPVRVVGSINKGEVIYVYDNGTASAKQNDQNSVGIALETNYNHGEKLVECYLKV